MKNATEMNCKELLAVAKELNIAGRHGMKKPDLLEAVLKAQKKHVKSTEVKIKGRLTEPAEDHSTPVYAEKIVKPKSNYLDTAKVGMMIAFRVSADKTISGKIVKIIDGSFIAETKNGIQFKVDKKAVIWVRTGDRWPKGVYMELKGMSATSGQLSKSC